MSLLAIKSAAELLGQIGSLGWDYQDCVDQFFVQQTKELLHKRYERNKPKRTNNQNMISSTCASLAFLAANMEPLDKAAIDTALHVLEREFLKTEKE